MCALDTGRMLFALSTEEAEAGARQGNAGVAVGLPGTCIVCVLLLLLLLTLPLALLPSVNACSGGAVVPGLGHSTGARSLATFVLTLVQGPIGDGGLQAAVTAKTKQQERHASGYSRRQGGGC